MIGFPIPPADLLARVEAHCPGWSARAQTRTNALAAGGPDPEFTSLWREIKAVYIGLQYTKCAYCERKLEAQPIEHDVEHYRPIKKVARWKIPKSLAAQITSVRQRARGSEPGYSTLAKKLSRRGYI